MTISFIVPVYGVEKYIHQCVDSILAQTFKDFELILVNDGSPDNCPHICDKYAEQDSRVKVIHQKNAGVAEARNAGIRAASGEWIYFVDSDDWIEPNAAEILYTDALRTGADYVVSTYVSVYENGSRKPFHMHSKAFYTDRREDIQAMQKNLIYRNFCPLYVPYLSGHSWGRLIRSSIIKDNGIYFEGYVKHFWEDGIFNLYVLEHIKGFYYNDKHTYNYRMLGDSWIHSFRADLLELMPRNHQVVMKFMAETGKDKNFLEAESCRQIGSLSSLLIRYFFHCQNTIPNKLRIRSLKKTLSEDPYRTAISAVNLRKLTLKHAYLALCVKAKCVIGLHLFVIIRRFLKRV